MDDRSFELYFRKRNLLQLVIKSTTPELFESIIKEIYPDSSDVEGLFGKFVETGHWDLSFLLADRYPDHKLDMHECLKSMIKAKDPSLLEEVIKRGAVIDHNIMRLAYETRDDEIFSKVASILLKS